ncbi:MAG: T9SS type A sorting domain-containing protein [Crocinitomicaceae bacterium]|nr:T9SS type A sorting domain-containing protein [Crocinitomicaceae bacterium]
MKKSILSVLLLSSGLSFAQTDINITLEHQFEGAPFVYGTTYMLNGTAVSLTRVQYYLSGFEITHDGGTVTTMPGSYILGSGNISNYTLGNEAVTNLEEINFDLGVDYTSNHMGTSSWTAGHPLASQSPSMDWSWPSGYFFWVFEGLVDDTGNGTPNKAFQLSGIGDVLHTDINSFTGINATGGVITLPFQVNVADWLQNLNLASVGSDHSASANNVQIGNNTNPETVFTFNSGALSLEGPTATKSHIYANYELPYAPTIFYNLATTDNVDIKIYSMSGAVVLESENENFEGNFFIKKELESGSYIIVFSNGNLEESFKFIVQK